MNPSKCIYYNYFSQSFYSKTTQFSQNLHLFFKDRVRVSQRPLKPKVHNHLIRINTVSGPR